MHDSLTRRVALKGMLSAGTLALARPAAHLLPLDAPPGEREISLYSISSRTLRITVQPVQEGNAVTLPGDGALVLDELTAPTARLRDFSGSKQIQCGPWRVTVEENSLSLRVEAPGGKLVQHLTLDPATGEFRFETGAGVLLGLGQGGPQFDRRGNADRMVSGQGGYHLGTHGARVPIQFLIGTAGWGMFVHAPLGAFDLSAQQGRLTPAEGQALLPLDVFVMAAEEPAAILREYASITGHPEMPPLWSLGYQQSHRTLGTPEEILAEARLFREKKLPCDAMIYLGTGFCPNGWNTDNGEFDWNARAFPDPSSAVAQMHDEHFKVVLHVVLEGKHLTGTVHDPCTAQALPTGRTPD
ncbi:MAG: TIM-barrel domain-containing protein, partial [Acidobacteriaceae bacterium]